MTKIGLGVEARSTTSPIYYFKIGTMTTSERMPMVVNANHLSDIKSDVDDDTDDGSLRYHGSRILGDGDKDYGGGDCNIM